jgi:hypothetical protein
MLDKGQYPHLSTYDTDKRTSNNFMLILISWELKRIIRHSFGMAYQKLENGQITIQTKIITLTQFKNGIEF